MNWLILLFLTTFLHSGTTSDSTARMVHAFFEEQPAPGAVVILIDEGSTVLFETLGVASREENRPVDPETTLFRVGSISKVVNAMGVLNRVEAGLLHLDRDINSHFETPIIHNRFETPVTLRHLLTHTAGLDDHFIGKTSRSREEAPSLEEAMWNQLPKQVMPPGEVASYSNFGAALSGYLAEFVSGMNYTALMDSILFQPLGMTQSTFDPDDQALAERFMTGYLHQGGGLVDLQYDFVHDFPAGSMVSTARDMERLMMALLSPSVLDEAGVLSREMTEEMLSVQFTHHPELSGGVGFLWNHLEYGGRHLIGHDGGYIGTASRLWLIPEKKSALFVAVNMMDFTLINRISDLFIEHLPDTPDSLFSYGNGGRYDDGRPLEQFAGTWRNTRYTERSFTKFGVLAGIMGQEIITAVAEDTLLTLPKPDGTLHRMVRRAPLLFESLDDGYKIAFREENGEITHLFTNGTTAFKRVHLLETVRLHRPFLLAGYLFFLFLSAGYLIRVAARKWRGKKPLLSSAGWAELGVAGFFTLTLIASVAAFLATPIHELQIGFGFGVNPVFYLATLLPYGALAFAILLLFRVIRDKDAGSVRKYFSLMIFLLSLLFFLSLNYWNLVGWKF